MSGATIYHGTPMTPRAALLSVCVGRAMCVSFYRPDDVGAVEAIAPFRHVRQRRVFILAGGTSARRGMGRASGLDALLRVVGAAPVCAGAVGSHPRHAGSAEPAQRWAAERLAIRAARRAPVAHGWADRASVAPVRALRPGLSGVDRAKGRFAGLSRAHVRGGSGARQPLACAAHDARHGSRSPLPIYERGQHFARTKRVAI